MHEFHYLYNDYLILLVLFCSFVEKYGTHIIVGVTIGGKDALYLKQNRSSSSSTVKIQNILKEKAKERFSSIEGRASREKNNLVKVSSFRHKHIFAVYIFCVFICNLL